MQFLSWLKYEKAVPPIDRIGFKNIKQITKRSRAAVLREAALRCLRNNKGDKAVGALF
jgi:hypothetical protein